MTTTTTGERKGFGCLHAAGIGCLVLVVIGVIAGVVVYYKAGSWARAAVAVGVEAAAEKTMENLNLPQDEMNAAMEPIREFTQKIRDGEVTLEQALAVGEALAGGPALAAVMARGFEVKYLHPSDLPDDEKQAGHVAISRFVNGVSTDRIPDEKAKEKVKEIGDIVTVKTTDSAGKTTKQPKDALTAEELRSCLKIMKDAADAAGVEQREFVVDLAAEIRKAIAIGLDKAPAAPRAVGEY